MKTLDNATYPHGSPRQGAEDTAETGQFAEGRSVAASASFPVSAVQTDVMAN